MDQTRLQPAPDTVMQFDACLQAEACLLCSPQVADGANLSHESMQGRARCTVSHCRDAVMCRVRATMTLACMSAVMPVASPSLRPMMLPTSSAGLLGATSATTILVTPSSRTSPKRRLACASFVSNVNLHWPLP